MVGQVMLGYARADHAGSDTVLQNTDPVTAPTRAPLSRLSGTTYCVTPTDVALEEFEGHF